jgi:hypothetical protein
LPNETFLNVWLKRPKANKENVIPLKMLSHHLLAQLRGFKWSDDAIGYMYCGVNDIQHATHKQYCFLHLMVVEMVFTLMKKTFGKQQ